MSVDIPLLQVLDRMRYGGIVIATDGNVVASNGEAVRILQDVFSLTPGELAELNGTGRELIKQLLQRGGTRVRLENENWIVIERAKKRPLIMNAVPAPVLDPRIHSVLILIDLDTSLQPNQAALEGIFGLTPAEARLSTLLASGATPNEAAKTLEVSLATVRSQLAAAFAKTRTRRQAELVMLVSRLSALP